MEMKLEHVDILMNRANISYEEAQAALTKADGDLLQALIDLEKDGKIKNQSASYSTDSRMPARYGNESAAGGQSGQSGSNGGGSAWNGPGGHDNSSGQNNWGGPGGQGGQGNWGGPGGQGGQNNWGGPGYQGYNQGYDYRKNTSGLGDMFRSMWAGLMNLIRRGNINHFEVYRHGNNIISIPVTVLIVLLILAFWVTLPAMVIGLFFGCRYRFRGPDLGRDSINRAMDSASDAAENIKQSVRDSGANTGGGPQGK